MDYDDLLDALTAVNAAFHANVKLNAAISAYDKAMDSAALAAAALRPHIPLAVAPEASTAKKLEELRKGSKEVLDTALTSLVTLLGGDEARKTIKANIDGYDVDLELSTAKALHNDDEGGLGLLYLNKACALNAWVILVCKGDTPGTVAYRLPSELGCVF